MMLDYGSLLLALGVSATCLAITLAGSWFARRSDTFLLTCTCGLVVVIAGIFIYGTYFVHPSKLTGVFALATFQLGFAIVWEAGRHFRTDKLSVSRAIFSAIPGLVLCIVPMMAGLDGLAFIAMNILTSAYLLATAREYWIARKEAPTPILGIAALYTLTSFSFALCAAHLIWDGNLVLGRAPSNWAEDLNLAICIASMTGIGALSLALHQWRLAARHRVEAMTDPLTGLLNRRALFDLYGNKRMSPKTAVLIFDIDHFKVINDTFGHASGDEVLRIFARKLQKHCRQGDAAARLGGEEFALVLHGMMPGRAEVVAESIRQSIELREIEVDGNSLKCTVSVGIAAGLAAAKDFEIALSAADQALYAAKRAGRNRVMTSSHLQAVDGHGARSAS